MVLRSARDMAVDAGRCGEPEALPRCARRAPGRSPTLPARCAAGSTATGCATGPATPEQQDNVAKLLASPAVAQYVNDFQFESKDDAYKHFKEQFSNSPIVDSVTPDQLPASFRINMKDPEKYQIISETFSSQAGVETVIDQRQLLERLFSVMNAASLVAVSVAGVMIVCAILLIATTIRLSAFSRRRETGIMRLVGASKIVIQLPFILEAALAGLPAEAGRVAGDGPLPPGQDLAPAVVLQSQVCGHLRRRELPEPDEVPGAVDDHRRAHDGGTTVDHGRRRLPDDTLPSRCRER